MLKNFLVASIATLFSSINSAHATTIDFGTHEDSDFAVDETYSQDGFDFTVTQGEQFAFIINDGNDNSGANGAWLIVGHQGPVGIDDTISITMSNSGLFTFDSVDYRSGTTSDQISDGVDIEGWRDGVLIYTIANLTSTSPVWETFDSVFTDFIDELRIVGASIGARSLRFDNFVFSEVPLPAAVWMFLAGLGGLGFARGKKRAA